MPNCILLHSAFLVGLSASLPSDFIPSQSFAYPEMLSCLGQVCTMVLETLNIETSLEYNKRSHAGIQDFNCHKCPSKSSRNWSLNCQLKVHLEDYLFKCKLCERKHRIRSTLNAHTKNDHDNAVNTKYPCDNCDYES